MSPSPQTVADPAAERVSRRGFFKAGLVGAGVLALGTIAYRLAVLPDGKPVRAGGVLTKGEMAALAALARGYFPPGNPFGLDADEADVAGCLDRYLAQLPRVDQNLIRSLIWAYDQGTLMSARWRPARLLTPAEAASYVRSWEHSRLGWRRDLALSLRTLFGMAYFAHPKALAAIGIVPHCNSGGPSLILPRVPA